MLDLSLQKIHFVAIPVKVAENGLILVDYYYYNDRVAGRMFVTISRVILLYSSGTFMQHARVIIKNGRKKR